jgi:YccS/YhfK family integral membrane protein
VFNQKNTLLKEREWIIKTLAVLNRDGFTVGVRAFLALSIVFLIHWLVNWQSEMLPVMLGVIASALTETDDHWHARLRSQLIAITTFSVVSLAVWFSLPWPALLAVVITVSAFALTLMGAMGERYRAISFGALVLVLYTALSAHSSRDLASASIPLLLIGAIWYGFISVIWFALLPQQPVNIRLAKLYALLGEYLQLKAKLLEPIREVDQTEQRMALILHNGRVVNALNSTKASLLSRMQPGKDSEWLKLALHQYLVAQDIHERTSSSHEEYEVLAKVFFHSDVLYRCQRVLILLGKQALAFSNSIQSGSKPIHHGVTKRAIEDLNSAIKNIEQDKDTKGQLNALIAVRDNLTSMASVMSQVFIAPKIDLNQDLLDREPTNFSQAWLRIKRNVTLDSPLFRHSLRLSCSLLIGFCIMQIMHDHLGYWILLTIVFVSQQQYAATHRRLVQRALGTAQGLAIGWAMTRLFDATFAQSALIVILGAVFFGTRHTRYILATAAITALLVVSFHQIGLQQELFPARLWDTLIGCAIAGMAAWLVIPNWQWRLWPQLAATTLSSQANYLEEIIHQYQLGKQEHLTYRFVRRDAHNADAALSNSYSAMLKEPQNVQHQVNEHGEFLIASHTLLNYLSALGAHRNEWNKQPISNVLLNASQQLHTLLKSLAIAVEHSKRIDLQSLFDLMNTLQIKLIELEKNSTHTNNVDQLLNKQLELCLSVLPNIAKQIAIINKYDLTL